MGASDKHNAEGPRFADEPAIVTQAVVHDENYWTNERFADMKAKKLAARALAPSLIGLSVDQARRVVDGHPELRIRFVHGPCTADYRYGRITASVRDGVVVSASDG